MGMIQVTLDDIHAKIKRAIKEGDNEAFQQAEGLLHQIINQNPDHWLPLFHLAGLKLHTGLHGEAVALFHRANELSGNKVPELFNNIGTCYRRENLDDKAEEYFLKALELKDDDPDLYNNLGTLHINNGDPEVAEDYFRKALALDPAHVHAHWNLGLALLEQEKFGEGFDEYAWGQFSKDRMNKDYGDALWWDGKAHNDGTLVVYGEQGIGDEIMFASMLEDVARRYGGRIILDCHPRLESLLRRSFPGITVYPTRKELTCPDWAQKEQPTHKVAMGTMGRYVRREVADFPQRAYLRADPDLTAEYETWLRLIGPEPYLGLGWVGGHKKTRKDLRAIRLTEFVPLLEQVPGTYLSLQYTAHGREDTRRVLEDSGHRIWHFPEVVEASMWEKWEIVSEDGEVLAEFNDKQIARSYQAGYRQPTTLRHTAGPAYNYDDTAAFVQAIHNLGGVIVTVNTSLVHLCGALGVDCYTLTPNKPAWRYGLTRKDMVMYGSIRQYRQDKADNWPFDDLITDLKSKLDVAEDAPCKQSA